MRASFPRKLIFRYINIDILEFLGHFIGGVHKLLSNIYNIEISTL